MKKQDEKETDKTYWRYRALAGGFIFSNMSI